MKEHTLLLSASRAGVLQDGAFSKMAASSTQFSLVLHCGTDGYVCFLLLPRLLVMLTLGNPGQGVGPPWSLCARDIQYLQTGGVSHQQC